MSQFEVNKKASKKLLSVAGSASVKEITRLIEEGADVDAADEYGWTPLMEAALFNKNTEVLRVFIERGADVNAADEDGFTPLMAAAWLVASPCALRLLIENGADVNAADRSGWTPLMSAAGSKNPEALRILIENGADASANNNNGRRAIYYAGKNGNLKRTDAYNLLQVNTSLEPPRPRTLTIETDELFVLPPGMTLVE